MENVTATARDQLRAFVERIERLNEEKQTIADDIKEVYGEAKAMGFDTQVLRKVIAIRKQDENERLEFQATLDSYLHALGLGGRGIVDPVRMEATAAKRKAAEQKPVPTKPAKSKTTRAKAATRQKETA